MNSSPAIAPNQPLSQSSQTNVPLVTSSISDQSQKNNSYNIPIVISIIGGVVHSLLLVKAIESLYSTIKFLNVTSTFGKHFLLMAIITVVGSTLVVFANFGFVFFLNSKKKKGEIVSNSLLSSLVIPIAPIIIQNTMYLLALPSLFN